MKILGTGLTGLVGSRIAELLRDKYDFENLSRASGVDISDKNKVLEKIKNSEAQIVLHLAAKTDVDGCEIDKPLGQDGEAWKINVEGTRNIANGCLQTDKKLIYVSTDFVFDGKNPPEGGYAETDIPNPINWYAQTKYEAEKIVQNLKTPWIVARIAYPYRAKFTKPDFFRAILEKLREGKAIEVITDQIFTPTLIDDIALALHILIQGDSVGIFHVVGSQRLTPFDAANIIADEFLEFDKSIINKTTMLEFFNNRAPRPFQLAIKNDRITRLGVKMRTFIEGIRGIKRQYFFY
jgi:dTDP-4-dehydrorhamnose reductase